MNDLAKHGLFSFVIHAYDHMTDVNGDPDCPSGHKATTDSDTRFRQRSDQSQGGTTMS